MTNYVRYLNCKESNQLCTILVLSARIEIQVQLYLNTGCQLEVLKIDILQFICFLKVVKYKAKFCQFLCDKQIYRRLFEIVQFRQKQVADSINQATFSNQYLFIPKPQEYNPTYRPIIGTKLTSGFCRSTNTKSNRLSFYYYYYYEYYRINYQISPEET